MNRILRSSVKSCGLLSRRIGSRQLLGNAGMPSLPQRVGNGAACYRQSCWLSHDSAAAPDASTPTPPAPLPVEASALPMTGNANECAFSIAVLGIRSSAADDAVFVEKMAEYLSTVQALPADISAEALTVLGEYTDMVMADASVDRRARLQLFQRGNLLFRSSERAFKGLTGSELVANLARYGDAGLRNFRALDKAVLGLDAQGLVNLVQVLVQMKLRWKSVPIPAKNTFWKAIEQNIAQFQPTDASVIVNGLASLNIKNLESKNPFQNTVLPMVIARAQGEDLAAIKTSELVTVESKEFDLVFSAAVLDIRAGNENDAVFVEKMAEYLATVPTIPIMSPEALNVLGQYTDLVMANTNAEECRQERLQLLGRMKGDFLYKSFQRTAKGMTSNETAAQVVLYAKVGLAIRAMFDRAPAMVGLDAQGVRNVVQAMQTMGTDWEMLHDFVKRNLWLSIEHSMTQFRPADASMIVNALASMGVHLNTSDPLQKSALSKLAAQAQGQDVAMVPTASGDHDTTQPIGAGLPNQSTAVDSAAIRESAADAMFNKAVVDIKASNMNDAAFVAKLSEYLSTVQFIPAVSPEANNALLRYIAIVVADPNIECHARLEPLERLGLNKRDMLLTSLVRTTSGRGLPSNDRAAILARYAKAGVRTSLVFFESAAGLDIQGVCNWMSAAKTMGMWKQLTSDTRKKIWKSIEQNMPNFRPADASMIVESFSLLGVTTKAEDSLQRRILSQLKRIAQAQAPCAVVDHEARSEAIPSAGVYPAVVSAVVINDNAIDLAFSAAVLDIGASNENDAVFVEKMAEYLSTVTAAPTVSPEAVNALIRYTDVVVTDTAGDCQARLQLLGKLKRYLLNRSFQRATKGLSSNETAAQVSIYAKAGLGRTVLGKVRMKGLDTQGVCNVVQAMKTVGITWKEISFVFRRHLLNSIEKNVTHFQPADASVIAKTLFSLGADLNSPNPNDALQKKVLSKLIAQAQDPDLAALVDPNNSPPPSVEASLLSHDAQPATIKQIAQESQETILTVEEPQKPVPPAPPKAGGQAGNTSNQQSITSAEHLLTIVRILGEQGIQWTALNPTTQQSLCRHLESFAPKTSDDLKAVLSGLASMSAIWNQFPTRALEEAIVKLKAPIATTFAQLGRLDASWNDLDINTLRALTAALDSQKIGFHDAQSVMSSLAKASFDCDYAGFATSPDALSAEQRERMELLWRSHRAVCKKYAFLHKPNSSHHAELAAYLLMLNAVPGGQDVTAMLGSDPTFFTRKQKPSIGDAIGAAALAELEIVEPGRFSFFSGCPIQGIDADITVQLDGELFAVVKMYSTPSPRRQALFTQSLCAQYYPDMPAYLLQADSTSDPLIGARLAVRIIKDSASRLLAPPIIQQLSSTEVVEAEGQGQQDEPDEQASVEHVEVQSMAVNVDPPKPVAPVAAPLPANLLQSSTNRWFN